MNNQKTVAAFEAVLFASGEPISIERLSQIFEIKPEKVQEIANMLCEKLQKENSGIKLLNAQYSAETDLNKRKELGKAILKLTSKLNEINGG